MILLAVLFISASALVFAFAIATLEKEQSHDSAKKLPIKLPEDIARTSPAQEEPPRRMQRAA